MSPQLSIIIPCYNSQNTLEKTLISVLEQDYQNWEAIMVNDGSPDNLEEIALKWIEKDGRFKYFKKENGGLGSARNYGINKSKGIYILPLDSDNLVEPDFAINAIKIFEDNNEIGVVHGHAEYFGKKNGIWTIDDFNLEKILIVNYIDACAIYKKSLWLQTGGYDEKMPYQGHEDWEFWIALGVLNVNFYHLNQITFKYYVCNNSMINSFNNEMLLLNQDYIVHKYSRLFHNRYSNLYNKNELLHSEYVKNKTSKELMHEVLFRIKRRLRLK